MKERINTSKTSAIAIEHFSKRIQEAEKALEYSLYLGAFLHPGKRGNPPIPKENLPDYIETLPDKIWKDCHAFVNEGEFNFFGYKNNAQDLSTLWYHPPFWKHALKQDAILFAFNTLRKVIGESYFMSPKERMNISNSTVNSYEMVDKRHHGFDFLTKTDNPLTEPPWLSLDLDKNQTIPKISKTKDKYSHHKDMQLDIDFSHNAQNNIRRIQNLNKNLRAAELSTSPLLLSPKADPYIKKEFLLSLLEFYDFTVTRSPRENDYKSNEKKENPLTSIQPIIEGYAAGKPFSISKYEKYIECVDKLINSIEVHEISKDFTTYATNPSDGSVNKHRLTLSDKIYLRYQIERVFAPSTINCLYQNLVQTKDTEYALTDQASINSLAPCLKLPNVFTRQYILQMTVDTISKHFDYNFKKSNFFTNKIQTDAVMTFTRPLSLNSTEKLKNWRNQYNNAISYLVKILFPVYENYFFCALWNAVKEAYKNDNYTDAQIVLEMYRLLQRYLDNPENAGKLFATDDVIINAPYMPKGFKRENIIHPSFSYDNTIDTKIYKNCLIAHNLTYRDGILPDFISLSYLNLFGDNALQSAMNNLNKTRKNILQPAMDELIESTENILQLTPNKLVLHPGRNYSFVLAGTGASHTEQNRNDCPDSF